MLKRFLIASAIAAAMMTAAIGQGILNPVTPLVNGAPVSPSAPLPVIAGNATPLGYQQIAGLSSATALTVPTGATYALITTESQVVRYRDDGTNPTASVGMPLAVGAYLIYKGTLSNLKFIQQSATATLDIIYYQ